MTQRSGKMKIIVVALIIISVTLFVVSYFIWTATAAQSTSTNLTSFRIELAKSLLQLGSIAIIGGGIAAFIKFYLDGDLRARELQRQDTQRKLDLYNDFIDRSGTAYREAKGCRRRLRSTGLTRKFGASPGKLSELQGKKYYEESLNISEIQLRLEQLKIESRTHPDLAQLLHIAKSKSSNTAYDQLRSMEKYLGRIVTEFERTCGAQFSAGDREPEPVDFDNLPKLSEFTDGAPHAGANGLFHKEFVEPHHALIGVLQSALTHLAEPI